MVKCSLCPEDKMRFTIPLALILIAVVLLPWLLIESIPSAAAYNTWVVALSIFSGLFIFFLCIKAWFTKKTSSTSSLEKRARRIAEEANRRNRQN
ncbi:hypothetical protein HMPREF1487_09617 [Pseudomonas sp. HPB0071]|nr:hypothetical protein HMPREF1487_09617 [Pseudomonas sp. HPB0071]